MFIIKYGELVLLINLIFFIKYIKLHRLLILMDISSYYFSKIIKTIKSINVINRIIFINQYLFLSSRKSINKYMEYNVIKIKYFYG